MTPERIRELWFIAWDRYKIVPVQAYDFACAIEREARCEALEEAAKLAETWGNAPPNPLGRRAACANRIRALIEEPRT